jgi:regulator of RNase E activity RraA
VSSNTLTRTAATNVPLEFVSENQKVPMIIHPGDFILGDADGVVAIPPAIVEQCLKLCEERWAVDEKIRECLLNGEPFGPAVARLRK